MTVHCKLPAPGGIPQTVTFTSNGVARDFEPRTVAGEHCAKPATSLEPVWRDTTMGTPKPLAMVSADTSPGRSLFTFGLGSAPIHTRREGSPRMFCGSFPGQPPRQALCLCTTSEYTPAARPSPDGAASPTPTPTIPAKLMPSNRHVCS